MEEYTLSSNSTIPQNSQSHPNTVFYGPSFVMPTPFMGFLPFEHELLFMSVGKNLHDDPFCDLRGVNTGGVGEGDFGFFPLCNCLAGDLSSNCS
jgi:hypothetical protein